MPSRRRVVIVLLTALAFGLFAGWAKAPAGDGIHAISQMRGALGNLSTPWLVVPFIAGAGCTHLRSAAMLGLAATMTALTGFYASTAAILHVDGRGFLGSLLLWASANRGYFEAGVVTGPLLGAVGPWWLRARTRRTSVMVGLLMVSEPLVLLAMGAVFDGALGPNGWLPTVIRLLPGWGLSAASGAVTLSVYAAEFVVGLAVVVTAARRALRPQLSTVVTD